MEIIYTQAHKLTYNDNLLIVEARHDDIEIEKHHVLECYQAVEQLTLNNKYLILTLPNKNNSVTLDAQKEAMKEQYFRNVVAIAIVIHSAAQRILTNFMFKFYKIKCPRSVHSSKENAMEWLKQQWNNHLL